MCFAHLCYSLWSMLCSPLFPIEWFGVEWGLLWHKLSAWPLEVCRLLPADADGENSVMACSFFSQVCAHMFGMGQHCLSRCEFWPKFSGWRLACLPCRFCSVELNLASSRHVFTFLSVICVHIGWYVLKHPNHLRLFLRVLGMLQCTSVMY